VQTVRAHNRVEITLLAALEPDANTAAVVIERAHRVVEDQFRAAFKRVKDHRRQIGPGDGCVPFRWPDDRGRIKRGNAPPVVIDGSRLREPVSTMPQLIGDAHPFGHVEGSTPEIH
jgi:hypothetical protein